MCLLKYTLQGFPVESEPILPALLLCLCLSFNSPPYAGTPSKNVKVDQNIRVGEEGEGIKSKLKQHNAHSLQNMCCISDVDSHSLLQIFGLKLPFF